MATVAAVEIGSLILVALGAIATFLAIVRGWLAIREKLRRRVICSVDVIGLPDIKMVDLDIRRTTIDGAVNVRVENRTTESIRVRRILLQARKGWRFIDLNPVLAPPEARAEIAPGDGSSWDFDENAASFAYELKEIGVGSAVKIRPLVTDSAGRQYTGKSIPFEIWYWTDGDFATPGDLDAG